MKKRHTSSGFATGRGGGIVIGIVLQAVLLVILCAVGALIAIGGGDPVPKAGAYSLAAFLITGALSALIISATRREGGFISAFLSSLAFVIILFTVGIISGGGKLAGAVFVNYLCYLPLSALFAYLGGLRRGRRHRSFR